MRSPALLAIALFLSLTPGRAQEATPGLQTATFDTLSGTVTVQLPEEIVAGDRISGTVVAEPSGSSDKKREKNLGTLSGYVLEMEDQREEVGNGRVTLDMPGLEASSMVTLVLREVRKGKPGRTVGSVDIPLLESAPAMPDFRLPTVGQPGRSLVVRGPFDGDVATSGLTVGGVEALPLAESPRSAVFRSPEGVVGVSPMVLRERGEIAAEGELRNVAVSLAAPKLNLRPGESTTLSTVVSGLDGLDEEIPFTLKVWPETVVAVEGGNRHELVVRPEDVRADGSYGFELSVTGRLAGGWSAEATVETPVPSPAERFVLVLEGQPVGHVESVSGGTISPGEQIRFDAGLDLAPPLYDWIAASFDKGHVVKSGEIVAVDGRGAKREVHEFHRAVVDSVSFPPLDAGDTSPASMTVTIAPAAVNLVKGSGEKVAKIAPATKKWLCSNFRFELGDLPLDRVSTVDSFTWKSGVTKKEVGSFREPTQHPAALEVPNLVLNISTTDLAAWDSWHRTFAGPEREAGNGLDGRLVFLGPDRGSALAAVELHDATMASLTVRTAGAATTEPHSVVIELVQSRLSFIP